MPMNEKADKIPNSAHSTLSSPWIFFGLVFCWSWSFWIAAAALGINVQSALGQTLKILGLLGPMFGGIGFAYFTQSPEGWREYLAGIIDPKRIGPKWYLVIFLFVPMVMAVSALLDSALSGGAALTLIAQRVTPFLAAPLTIFPFVLGLFINGPIPEELGWRGYVLDRLQARWNALTASLILGAIWAVWHVPLFFMTGMKHETQGVGSPWFWLFMVSVIPMAVIFTWIFNNTRRSTLAAILFHFMANLTYELTNVTAGTNLYSCCMWIGAAIFIVALWGARTLTRATGAQP
jgi:uncharacterized protein